MIPNANYAQAQMNAAAQQVYYNQIQNTNNAAMLDVGSARLATQVMISRSQQAGAAAILNGIF